MIRLGKTATELVAILGKTPAYWSNLMRDAKKSFGEKAARRIEELWPLPRGWMDVPHRASEVVPAPGRRPPHTPDLDASSDVAHDLSYPQVTTPPLTVWEDVVSLEKMPVVPADLMVEVPDDALAPRGLARGQHVWFKAAAQAQPRNVVLIEANGRRYIRRYAEDSQGPFAQALDDAYPSFREFKVVAVMHMRPESSI